MQEHNQRLEMTKTCHLDVGDNYLPSILTQIRPNMHEDMSVYHIGPNTCCVN